MSRGEIPIMEDTINKLIEILDMTENTDYSAKLSHLKQTIEKMEFMVSVTRMHIHTHTHTHTHRGMQQ